MNNIGTYEPSFPDRPVNYTIAWDGMEEAEMMDVNNVPYIGIQPVKKRRTVKELWEAFKNSDRYRKGGSVVSSWMEREQVRVEIEEGRV